MIWSYKKLLEKGVLNVSLYYQIERLKKINFKEYLELCFGFRVIREEIDKCESFDELGYVLFDRKWNDGVLLGEDIEVYDVDGKNLFNSWFNYLVDENLIKEEFIEMLFKENFELNEFKVEDLKNEFVDLGYDKVSIMIKELKVKN